MCVHVVMNYRMFSYGGRIQGELEFGSRVQYAAVHEHEAAEAVVVLDGLDDGGRDIHILRSSDGADFGEVRCFV